MTRFHQNWNKIVDLLSIANFEASAVLYETEPMGHIYDKVSLKLNQICGFFNNSQF